MSLAAWVPGTVYLPGVVVQRRTAAAAITATIVNGGAEAGALTHWTASGAGAWSVTAQGAKAGSYRFNWTGTGTGTQENDTHVTVAPDQVLSVTAFVNAYGGATQGASGKVGIAFYNVSNVLLSTHLSPATGDPGNGWGTRTVTAIAPATTSYALVRFVATAAASGSVGFDEVVVSFPGGDVLPPLLFKATQAASATSSSTEPTWPTTVGGTVVDGGVTWTAVAASRVVWKAGPIIVSGASEPTWPTNVGERVTDSTASWEAVSRRVEDVNCPNTDVVAILASKVFAVDQDIVRFCATTRPLDWTSPDDAGYLPTGLQQANANDMAVLAPYRSNLAAFNASSFQNWQVDPDPAAMAMLDQMDGVGSQWPKAAQPVANDLFYVSQLGVRSVGISAGAENLAAGDIGMPIDELVQDALRIATANGTDVIATYYPGAGQYWLAFPNYPPDEPEFDMTPVEVDGVTVGGVIPDGYVGEEVLFRFAMTGGVAPFSYAVTAGSMPDGTAMDENGNVTGTRLVQGVYPYEVTAVDALGTPAVLSNESENLPFTISGDVPDGDEGDEVSGAYTNTHGVEPITYAVTVGTFPAGVILDDDGTYAGTLETGGYSWITTGTDAAGNTATVGDFCSVEDVPATFNDLVTAKNPIAWWKLDETTGTTLADSIGSLPGTKTGSVTLNNRQLRTGAGNAPYFEPWPGAGGNASHIDIASGTFLDIIDGQEYSVLAIVRPNAVGPAQPTIFGNKVNPALGKANLSFGLFADGGDHGVQLGWWHVSGLSTATASTLANATTYMLCMSYDVDEFRIGINDTFGAPAADPGAGTPFLATTSGSYIGSWPLPDSVSGSFDGWIGDVIVFRSKMTDDELAAFYAAAGLI